MQAGQKTKMKVKSLSCIRLCDPMDCNLPGSSIHGILQARVLGWVAICFSRGSSWSRDWTWISCFMGRLFMVWATRQSTLGKVKNSRKGIIVWSVVKLWVDQPDWIEGPLNVAGNRDMSSDSSLKSISNIASLVIPSCFLQMELSEHSHKPLWAPCVWYMSGGSHCIICEDFLGGSDSKESSCNSGDSGLIPGLRRPLEKGTATPSSILAWRIPWTEKSGGLQSMGSQRVGHDCVVNTLSACCSLCLNCISPAVCITRSLISSGLYSKVTLSLI